MTWKFLVLAALVCAVVGLLLLEEREEALELTILHTNDLHAHYDSFEPWGDVVQGGAARLKTVVEEILEEDDDILFLDAGDQFQGTLFFTVGGAQVVADVMNELGYDAMCLGNHEFDAGPAELAAFIEEADFPVLSANVDAFADADLAGMIQPYEIFDFDGVLVAVIGLTTEHTATASSPGPNVRFLDAIEVAQRTADELAANDIDVIIALTHLGTLRDVEMAQAVSGIDVIIGGHSHTLLEDYPMVTSSASGEPVLVITAHEWGKRLGRLDVSFTKDGLVGAFSGEPIFIDESIPEDEGMLALLNEYRPAIDALMTQVVGSTDVDLNGAREDIRVRETNLGNLICDAMLWKSRGLGATVAIQNGGGIRASIPAGEITMGQVLEVLPYGNQLTVLTIIGDQLTAALENGVSAVEDGAGQFPHVGGMRYTFDSTLQPGRRVTVVEIWDAATKSYIPIDPAATYLLATNNFLASGGDGFDFSEATDRYDSGWLLSDALAEFFRDQGVVAPEIEGRIREGSSDAP
jgi:5'-nucleotidase/UDP-sugar diphosphatase